MGLDFIHHYINTRGVFRHDVFKSRPELIKIVLQYGTNEQAELEEKNAELSEEIAERTPEPEEGEEHRKTFGQFFQKIEGAYTKAKEASDLKRKEKEFERAEIQSRIKEIKEQKRGELRQARVNQKVAAVEQSYNKKLAWQSKTPAQRLNVIGNKASKIGGKFNRYFGEQSGKLGGFSPNLGMDPAQNFFNPKKMESLLGTGKSSTKSAPKKKGKKPVKKTKTKDAGWDYTKFI